MNAPTGANKREVDAIARRSSYIVQINRHDELFIKVIKNTQHVSYDQAIQLISKKRVESYIKEGLVKKIRYFSNKESGLALEFTKKGRNWANRKFPHLSRNSYTNTTAVRHNIKLAEIAIENTMKKRPLLCERDLREYINRYIAEMEDSQERGRAQEMVRDGSIGVPDIGVVHEDGTISCYEVTNDNYTAEILEQKAMFQTVTGISVTFIKQH